MATKIASIVVPARVPSIGVSEPDGIPEREPATRRARRRRWLALTVAAVLVVRIGVPAVWLAWPLVIATIHAGHGKIHRTPPCSPSSTHLKILRT
jgi:hypothetical protein